MSSARIAQLAARKDAWLMRQAAARDSLYMATQEIADLDTLIENEQRKAEADRNAQR